MSVIVETTKYVLDYLKTVVPNVLCRRSYDPIADVVELRAVNKPVVLVVPIDRQGELFREGGTIKNDLMIDIVVSSKLQHSVEEPELQLAEIDQLIELVETIFSACHKRNIKDNETGIEIHLMNPEHFVLNDLEMIEQHNCFLSAISINVKVFIN
jgi:hypothetical protein